MEITSYTRTQKTERQDGKIPIKAKFKGWCAGCRGPVDQGEVVFYMPEMKCVWHVGCADLPRKSRVGYSSKASRSVGLNGGGGSRNKRVR